MEKPDVIGAIFGQTEGLLGSDLDLRDLQKTGRIGRIEVRLRSENGKTKGKISIPSSLDSSETSLIAASLETIEKIGPCAAKIEIEKIKDVRAEKREYVTERAREILREMIEEELPSTSALSERIKKLVRESQLKEYKGLVCGPDIAVSTEVIIVEGRADVVNLLKNGVRNAIAMDGTKISKAIVELTKEKITTLFVDGDRAGDLIVKEFLQLAEVDFIARAPPGKEVEELTKKEIFKAIRERISLDQYRSELK